MPIAGVVVSCVPEKVAQVSRELAHRAGVDIHGISAGGELVAVLEAVTSDAMEQLIRELGQVAGVLHVGLSYLNTEDEAALMATGRQVPNPFVDRRHERDES